jgi:hypothetical protein
MIYIKLMLGISLVAIVYYLIKDWFDKGNCL